MGPYVVTVSHAESVSGSAFGDTKSQLSKPGEQVLAVFFDVEGVQSKDFARLRLMFMSFKIQDSEGHTYPGLLPLTVKEYLTMRSEQMLRTPRDLDSLELWSDTRGETPREWVFLFAAPEKSQGFTLLMENITPEPGQPDVAAVPLGR